MKAHRLSGVGEPCPCDSRPVAAEVTRRILSDGSVFHRLTSAPVPAIRRMPITRTQLFFFIYVVRRVADTNHNLVRATAAVVAGLLFLGIAIWWRQVAAQANSRLPVVLISIDGLKPDYVLEAAKHNLKIPQLRRFLSEGSYASGVTGVLPTVTYPSHTTIVTGVSPAKHGIVTNKPFDPFRKNFDGWYWYAEDIKVPTLWDVAAKAGITTAGVHWPVTAGANITYNLVQYWRADAPDDRKLLRLLSTPKLIEEAEQVLGPYPDGADETVDGDRGRAAFNVFLLEKKKPGLLFCYFTGLDHQQHETGPYSPEAISTLEKIDALVGQVRAAAEKMGAGRAVICVVSDHGFFRVEKELRLNVALLKAGLMEVDEKGKLKSWKACAWVSGGCAAVMLNDSQKEELRKKTRAVLTGLLKDPANGIHRILEKDQILRLGGFPDAAFVVGMREGYRLSGELDGAVLRSVSHSGTHGFLPEHSGMNASFFIVGPSLPSEQSLGQIDMRDIAPTLAHILGFQLPSAEGRNLFP